MCREGGGVLCEWVYGCVCVRACACARVCVCVHAHVCVHVCVCVHVREREREKVSEWGEAMAIFTSDLSDGK